MKKNYLFFIILVASMQSFAQSNCNDAHSDVIYAYSHVKSAYNSNNVTHLKHYSKRSLDAFERAKVKLNDCQCEASYNHAYDSAELLQKVANAQTFEDGRFYVKRARDLAKKVIDELEICTKLSIEDEALAELENEQFKLKQQQIELNLKETKIKQLLADREARELQLKKEQLIKKNELVLSANINSYNNVLGTFKCELKIPKPNFKKDTLLSKNLNQINKEYLTIFKKMSTKYLEKLNTCTD